MKNIVLVSVALTLVMACSRNSSDRLAIEKLEHLPLAKPEEAVTPVLPGEIVVQLKPGKSIEKYGKAFQVVPVDAKGGVYLLKNDSLKMTESVKAAELMATGDFEIAEPNFLREINAEAVDAPRDPKWLELWGLKNYGQDSPSGTEGLRKSDISALEAWSVTKGSKEVVVAVLDTGIDYRHPDLAENMFRNELEVNGVIGVDDDGNGYVDDIMGWDFVSGARDRLHHGQLGDPDAMDDNGHGTHCAGTIGAVGNNSIGVTGVNWKVRLMPLKFLNNAGSGSSVDEYRALKYAAQMKVDVISASYGGGGPSALVKRALEDAGRAGVLFVAAAGNEESNTDTQDNFPSNYDIETIVSVAATDNRDQLAVFSNFGEKTVDLAAPGVAVVSTYSQEVAKSEGKPEPYRALSGTSMATPHVAGAAALVLAAQPALKGKPVQIKEALMKSVDWLPQLAGKVVTGGRLNLAKAVKLEVGQSPVYAANEWKEEPYELMTPRYPVDKMDHAWKIQKVGAKAISVHIQEALIDVGFDVARIFDQHFRPLATLEDTTFDYWTPAIPGDSVYLKFSNAMVSVRKYLGVRRVVDPGTITDAVPTICFKEVGSLEYECHVHEKESSKPFANFASEGVRIDRIKFVP